MPRSCCTVLPSSHCTAVYDWDVGVLLYDSKNEAREVVAGELLPRARREAEHRGQGGMRKGMHAEGSGSSSKGKDSRSRRGERTEKAGVRMPPPSHIVCMWRCSPRGLLAAAAAAPRRRAEGLRWQGQGQGQQVSTGASGQRRRWSGCRPLPVRTVYVALLTSRVLLAAAAAAPRRGAEGLSWQVRAAGPARQAGDGAGSS